MVIEYPLSESTMRGDSRRLNLGLVIIPLSRRHHPVLATAQFMLNAINIEVQAQGHARLHVWATANPSPACRRWILG